MHGIIVIQGCITIRYGRPYTVVVGGGGGGGGGGGVGRGGGAGPIVMPFCHRLCFYTV